MYAFRILSVSVLALLSAVLCFGGASRAASVLSDRLLVTDTAGVTVFDNSIPETSPTGVEGSLTFAGGPANVPPPIPIATAITIPGVSILVLTEPAPDPTEPPLVLAGPAGNIFVSDVVVSTLTVPGIPSFVTLLSDGDPLLPQILPALAANPNLHLLAETGQLQDVTSLVGGLNSPLGSLVIQVQSDAPEPELLLLLGSALALLCVARARPRLPRAS